MVRLLLLLSISASAQAGAQQDVVVEPPVHRVAAPFKMPSAKGSAGAAGNVPLNGREQAAQMLNRFAYGARPGDVEHVAALGARQWLEVQLRPESIKDAAADAAMRQYPTLKMTPLEALTQYPSVSMVRQMFEGKVPMPSDPLLKSLYEVKLYRYGAVVSDKDHHPAVLTAAEEATKKTEDAATAARVAGQLLVLPRKERMPVFEALPVAERSVFVEYLTGEQRATFLAELQPRERQMFTALRGSTNSAFRTPEELGQAKVVRSVLSERQVQEVMTDFWFNHFNIYADKDSDQWYTTAYERDVIRPHALGKFRDLLLATAESPAMMVYLDNWLSIGPHSVANGVNPANPNSKPGKRGLNENYGREVMELHTIGVGGGYSQEDVTHLSEILTGWGVNDPGHGGPFEFDAKRHEPGAKQWLGYTIDDAGMVSGEAGGGVRAYVEASNAPDGMKQGVAALALLAGSPKTAHFISYLLAQRFVADDPPAALVDRMTATFLQSDGDIASVLRTLAGSADFNSHRYFRNKMKTPFEFLVSAFRATATEPQNAELLTGELRNTFGEPPYHALSPTGYYITADHWMNSASLLARLNFADQLTKGRLARQTFDAPRVLALALLTDHAEAKVVRASATPENGSEIALRVLEGSLIGGELSPATRNFIKAQMAGQAGVATGAGTAATLNLLIALLLGSPEFQVR